LACGIELEEYPKTGGPGGAYSCIVLDQLRFAEPGPVTVYPREMLPTKGR